jgi:hypothetical protein
MATPPLAHRTTRVSILGTMFGGAEEWSTGFWIGSPAADAALPTQAQADAIAAAWRTYFTAAASGFSGNFTTTAVKLASVGIDGKSSASDTIYSTLAPAANGGNNNGAYPPQIALVATLSSTVARGVGSKGRMYLPGIFSPVDATGHIASAAQGTMLANLVTFLRAVNNAQGNFESIVLASHGSVNRDGTPKIDGRSPITTNVTSVRLGNVFDTQRRRRNALREVYQTTPLAV